MKPQQARAMLLAEMERVHREECLDTKTRNLDFAMLSFRWQGAIQMI